MARLDQRPLHPDDPPTLGALVRDEGGCGFRVWAPRARQVELCLTSPAARRVAMTPCEHGYFEAFVEDVGPQARYFYRLDGKRELPDPASRFQPEGVHRASAVVERDFPWTDASWHGIPLHAYVTYELHVGTYTPEGTFEAVIGHLDELCDLGVTAVEIMPVAQFPGGRNWGYDGVHLFAPQNTYGGPRGLKRLVDAAHARGLAIVLDVVYNHIGPEGNYLGEFGHYFTDRHRTPWGDALNFDDRDSDEVRRFFIENALHWLGEYHVDALRLDAVHAIYDASARPFLRELADAVRLEGKRANRQVFTIAESSSNDPRIVTPREAGGYGIDAQWNDDFHHSLRTLMAGEHGGYYADFHGLPDLVKTYNEGWALDGRYCEFRGRRHGNSARDIPPERLVVFSQDHDQIGNRMLGERLSATLTFEELKLAAALVLLSPFQPLLFMGEEYGETAPFQYFISHTDEALIEAVRRGRQQEFARFAWNQPPPDPQDEATFERCKLRHKLKQEERGRALRGFYAELLRIRRENAATALPRRETVRAIDLAPCPAMAVLRWARGNELLMLYHFGAEPARVTASIAPGAWAPLLDSTAPRWLGPGSVAPPRLQSRGEVELTLPALSAWVYRRDNDRSRGAAESAAP